jgi:hypothetical protein
MRGAGTLRKLGESPGVVSPGDSVLLARGGMWREPLPVAAGTAGARVTYSSFGDASLPKPLVIGSASVGSDDNWMAVEDGDGSVGGGGPHAGGLWRSLPAK